MKTEASIKPEKKVCQGRGSDHYEATTGTGSKIYLSLTCKRYIEVSRYLDNAGKNKSTKSAWDADPFPSCISTWIKVCLYG
jgi:hypothetical protein